ncbi:MAG: hypothetical protein KF795_05575 [Labilithrix sp.]|nr:hypothetical protein [Labilithrix sp.]
MFHVLAHLEAPGLAASCYSPAWIAHAAAALGPIAARPLGEDVATLARAATSHDLLARAQALAWVFDSAEAPARASAKDLDELTAEDVTSLEPLDLARSAGAVAEVLRAATELELPLLAGLDAIGAGARAELAAALAEAARAAPALRQLEVWIARPLGLRGRTFGRSIVVGLAGIGCPDPEHAAWQAAHEATVAETAARGPLPFLDLERRAIARLRSRARDAGLGEAHARWLARLDLRALGPIADVDDATE